MTTKINRKNIKLVGEVTVLLGIICVPMMIASFIADSFYPCKYKIVVKKISNGKILGKDVKTGTDKIFNYNTDNDAFNYVAEGDTMTYTIPKLKSSDYQKKQFINNCRIVPNIDSVYARKQRKLFNQELQQMSENQK